MSCLRENLTSSSYGEGLETDCATAQAPRPSLTRQRSHSWFNRFRKLLVSFEKTEASFVALLTLAAALICWRQTVCIYG